MTPLFKKLNLKDNSRMLVLDSPSHFKPELDALSAVDLHLAFEPGFDADFILAFVTSSSELDALASIVEMHTKGDVILWCSYPKKTSEHYNPELHRDADWSPVGRLGFEAVRQVAIDDDWSAIRFRRVEFIKSMQRDPRRALTAEGKRKTLKNVAKKR